MEVTGKSSTMVDLNNKLNNFASVASALEKTEKTKVKQTQAKPSIFASNMRQEIENLLHQAQGNNSNFLDNSNLTRNYISQ